MSVRIDSAQVAGSNTLYRLRILAEGSPVVALLPRQVELATLLVNGAIVQRAGRNVFINEQPFGHGAASFALTGLKPADRVEIVEFGSSGVPVIVTFDATSTAYWSGLGSGLYYGILVSLAIFQLLGGLTMKDPTRFWYVGWISAALCIELARDDLLPIGHAAAANMILLLNLSTTVCVVGFAATYLKLLDASRRLFWVLIVGNALTTSSIVLVGIATRAPVNIFVAFGATSLGFGIVILVAVLRRRAGFLPASYVALGVMGLLAVFVSKIVRDANHLPSPFFDRWGVEIGSVFDYFVFSLGLIYRSRFTQAQRDTLERALVSANVDASTDELTGLLNRRGVEAGIERADRSGTLLYIDLDDTLKTVAKILRRSVRSKDVVARFGGDEFVVFLAECDDLTIVRQIVSSITSAVTSLRPLGAQSATRIGVSIGTQYLSEMKFFAEALSKADADAYRVKAEHRAFARNVPARPAEDRGGSHY
jgi:diguanylate cyclase (GGDEF)-like protein